VLTPIGEGMYRGEIKGEVTYWLARGRSLPAGGMRGRGVLPLADTPILEAGDVAGLRGELIRVAQKGGLRHGADFGPVPLPDSTSMRVPLEGGGFAEVHLDIRIRPPNDPGAHGLESGHARNTLKLVDGKWQAAIEIDPRLRMIDAQLGLFHEVNEIAGIARRLHRSGLRGRALEQAILEQQQSSLTREGARGREPTEHDIATTIDLITLWQRFQADPSPVNRGTLENQIRAMGFSGRYFAQDMAPRQAASTKPDRTYNLSIETRDKLVRDHAPAGVSTPLLQYIDAWRTATEVKTPFRAADRPSIAARLLEYADALANRRPRSGVFRQPTVAGTLDLIERLAQAAMNRDRLTVGDLVENGVSPDLAEAIVRGLPGRNPYATLYAELESLIAIRHRVDVAREQGLALATSVGFGFARDLTAVHEMTRGGRLDGQPFAEVLRRIEAAHRRGLLVSDPGDPLRPEFSKPAKAESGVRLTWRFRSGPGSDTDSLFSIDLPGKLEGRPFQIGDMVHADLEPAKAGGGHAVEHLTETGVVVPAGSAPAHIWIVPDAAFATFVDALGLAAQRIRLEGSAPR
jgi:hypothetical protein